MASQRHYPLLSALVSGSLSHPKYVQLSNSLKQFLCQSLSIAGTCLLPSKLPLYVEDWQILLAKMKTKIWSISARTVSTVTKSLIPFSRGSTFSLFLFYYKFSSSSCPSYSLQISAPAELFFLASFYNFQLLSACLGSIFQNSSFESPLNSFHLLCTALLLQSCHELPA